MTSGKDDDWGSAATIAQGDYMMSDAVDHAQRLGPAGMVDRTELLRLIQQSLRNLGYADVARQLEEASGVRMQLEEATRFHGAVLTGEWEQAFSILSQLPLPSTTSSAVQFLLLEHRYMEQLRGGDTAGALSTLRGGLAPIAVADDRQARLHFLASLLVRPDSESIGGGAVAGSQRRTVPGFSVGCTKRRGSVGDEGASGSGDDATDELVQRRRLMRSIRAHLPPSLLLPESRLEELLEQALMAQLRHCVYHNQPRVRFTLLQDYDAGEEQLPSKPSQFLDTAHSDEVWVLSFNATGSMLASGGKDQTVVLWRVEDTELHFQQRIVGHSAPMLFVKWRPDGQIVLSGSSKAVLLHRVSTGHKLCELNSSPPGRATGANPEEGDISAACWHPDGESFMVAKFTAMRTNILETHVLTGSADTWCCFLARTNNVRRINDMQCLPSGKHLVAITNEQNIEVMNLTTGARLVRPQGEGILSMSLSSNAELLLVIFQRHVLHLWKLLEVEEGSAAMSQLTPHSPHENKFFGTSQEVGYDVIGSRGPCLDTSFPPLRQYTVAESRASRFHQPCCFGGMDDAFLAFSDDNCKIHIKHRETGRDLKELIAHTANVNALAWNPGCPHMLVSGSDDRTIRVWLSEVAMR